MQNLETIGRELQRSGKAEEIRRLAASEDGQKLGRILDGKAVEQAATRGDAEALRSMLEQVLHTEEGKRLAKNIQTLMQG